MKHRELKIIPRELASKLTDLLHRELRELGRRLLPIRLDQLIGDLCAVNAWSLRDLSLLLNRSPVYLQNTTIKRLLRQRRIRFIYPHEPNHPRQAYTATSTLSTGAHGSISTHHDPEQSRMDQGGERSRTPGSGQTASKPLFPKVAPAPSEQGVSIGIND